MTIKTKLLDQLRNKIQLKNVRHELCRDGEGENYGYGVIRFRLKAGMT